MDNEDVFKTEYLAEYLEFPKYENLYEEYDRLYELENDIMKVTGYTLKHLRDLFYAGWTLRAPYSKQFFY